MVLASIPRVQAVPDDAGNYIYGFRKDNQFSLNLAINRQRWQVADQQDFSSIGFALQLSYRFQLPIRGNIGYFLGTSCAFNYLIADRQFYSLSLPGATVGLVWYIDPRWQLLVNGEIFLERMPGNFPTANKDHSYSLESLRIAVTIERYWSLTLAYNFAIDATIAGQRLTHAPSPSVTNYGLRTLFGVSYHLL